MEFPRDHYNHPDRKTEWWYFAGIGDLEDVGRVNYHASFFRRFSRMLKKEIYFAHWGMSRNGEFKFKETRSEDIFNENHHSYCSDSSFHFHIGNWDMGGFGDRYTVMLDKGTSLTHTAEKRPIVNKDGYYSITDMFVKGIIERKKFRGKGWFDHEFNNKGSQDLANLNYKWFALQLNINIEMILYVFPNNPAESLGKVVFPNGDSQEILPGDYCLRGENGGWVLELPQYGMILTMQKQTEGDVKPDLGLSYKEGTVDILSRGKIGHGFFEIVERST